MPTYITAPLSLSGLRKRFVKRINLPSLVSLSIHIVLCQGVDGVMFLIRSALRGLPTLQTLIANFSFDDSVDYELDNGDTKVAFHELLQVLDGCPQLLHLDLSANWLNGRLLTMAQSANSNNSNGEKEHAEVDKMDTSGVGEGEGMEIIMGTGAEADTDMDDEMDDGDEEDDTEHDGEDADEVEEEAEEADEEADETDDNDSEASKDAVPYFFQIQTLWERCEQLQYLRISGNGFDFKNEFELPDKDMPLRTLHIKVRVIQKGSLSCHAPRQIDEKA